MSIPIPPPIGTGSSSIPSAHDYMEKNSKDLVQEITNHQIPQGSSWNRGVILNEDGLNVPLESTFGIINEQAGTTRPSLMPLFRIRLINDSTHFELSGDYYEKLRNSLSSEIKDKLETDEKEGKIAGFDNRDPDLIALDNSLKFEAYLLSMLNQFSGEVLEGNNALEKAQHYLMLPENNKI
jgi:hypothetical protein